MDTQVLIAAADYGLTTARLTATVVALVGVAGVVVGALAKSRPRRGLLAVVAGVVATVGGVVALAVADGGPGTGNGVVAAWAAVVLGPVAVALGGRVVARARTKA